MIKNNETVKIRINVQPVHTGEILVKIERWTKDIGWAKMDLYFTQDEYEKFVEAVGVESVYHYKNRR